MYWRQFHCVKSKAPQSHVDQAFLVEREHRIGRLLSPECQRDTRPTERNTRTKKKWQLKVVVAFHGKLGTILMGCLLDQSFKLA